MAESVELVNDGELVKPATLAESATLDESATQDAAKPDDAAKSTKQKQRLTPEEGLLLFDLALVEQSVAQLTSDLPPSLCTLADIDSATHDLDHSTRTFQYLAACGKSLPKRGKLLYSARLATERAGFGKSLVSKLQRKRDEQHSVEQQRAEHLEQWHKQREMARVEQERERERVENEQKEEEARILKETEERNAVIREEMARAVDAPKKRAKRREEEYGMSDEDARPKAQGRKKRLARGTRAETEGSDDEGARKRRNVDEEASDVDNASDEEVDSAPVDSNPRYKSKATVSDDDSE
ncbi:hypothetical protein GGH12_004968 [Coemansia sp. RSA 1822]|nr:hypothetical protein LPJ76_004878 [Coemansia sp. RSA 638]KAJ2540002.1 hypothetical protein GGF49_004789 [Coemansia sp. RSA 1853]KAJ2560263.1 hypothetical protein GGH12_004968 [Coemansia sp. RSA 1822]